MKKVFKPFGARLLVDPIITTVSLEKRAEMAGLHVVLEDDNVPAPTQGRVVALGSDPFLQEQVKVGDIVFFHHHSGHDVTLEGRVFHELDISEITGIMQEVPEETDQGQEQHSESSLPN